ncbi:MAG: hypothetical protein OXI70_03520 [Chloroflexota bacterium]|nr:hypothetical protein [Chloroflexota bacterium]
MRHYVIATRGVIYPRVADCQGGIDTAVAAARRAAHGGEWAVFLPADRSNTAGTMLVRGKGRKVRWFPAGREAAGLPQWDKDADLRLRRLQDRLRECACCGGSGWIPLGPSPGIYAVECALCAEAGAA